MTFLFHTEILHIHGKVFTYLTMAQVKSLSSFLLLSITFHLSVAQTSAPRLDSLARVASLHKSDTLGVLAYADLCYEYRFINQDSALRFGEEGITLGKKLGFKTGLAQVYSDAAFIYYDRSDFQAALSYWSSALSLRMELKDSPRVASLQLKLGGAHFRAGNYNEALRFQLDALRSYEALNMPQGIAQALNNVAAVYEQQLHIDKALEYYQRAFDIHQRTNNAHQMSITLINIGNINFRKHDYRPAKVNYQRAIGLLPENADPGSKAIALNNLSEIYTLENRNDSALYYSEKALALRKKTGDFSGMISSLNMMGRIHTRMGNYRMGEKYLLEGLDSANKKSILPEKGKIYLNLYEHYKQQGNWKKSLESHVNYAMIQDSLLNESGRKEIAALQVQYETAKKEQQIAAQAAALSEKELRIERDFIVIAALVVTLALSAIIFMLLRNRQRRKEEVVRKEGEIALREAYIRASIESQENERKRFARDLHDGMGQWISSLKLALSEIHEARTDAQKVAVLERSDRIMKDINHEFRSIAFNLMPYTLIHYGLKPAVEEMVTRLNASGKTFFSVTAFDFPGRLSELEEISLYRVIQEWTNNILKYAHASKVEIQLTGHDDELVIMIEDDGKGFNVQTLYTGMGNGWKNIQSRMNLIKGSVHIDSDPQRHGTSFTIRAIGVKATSREQTVENENSHTKHLA